jgi:hypothetical protein
MRASLNFPNASRNRFCDRNAKILFECRLKGFDLVLAGSWAMKLCYF